MRPPANDLARIAHGPRKTRDSLCSKTRESSGHSLLPRPDFSRSRLWARAQCGLVHYVLALALAIAACDVFTATARAAPDEVPVNLGAARCLDCHTQPSPIRQQDGTTDWVRLTEAHTWLTTDKHSQAFEMLTTEYSKRLGERLGILDVTKDQRCLSCHAGWAKGTPMPPQLAMGVSCEACHGPSSLYDLRHTVPAWRAKPADEKAELGMIDVREPRRRSELCLSCHLGSAAEGKLLTHAMYAAGHPPLPGFESATFAQAMPPHWRELGQKAAVVRDDDRIRQANGYKETDLPDVKAVVIGGVVALRESVRLSGEWAAANSGGWPDFAQYDCAACHHELERPSWRQTRSTPGRPGRLFVSNWPVPLAEIGVKRLERDDATAGELVRQDFDRRLVDYLGAGSSQRTASCERLGETLDILLRRLDDLPYDRSAAGHLLRDVGQLGQRGDLDFDSARQLGWAFQTIYWASYGNDPARPAPQALAELAGMLLLDLASTREQKILDLARQQAMYDALGGYQPSAANSRFAILLQALEK
jgi:hypothetical protein